jgi:hypothetical protein
VTVVFDSARKQNIVALQAENYGQEALVDAAIDAILQHLRRLGFASEFAGQTITPQRRIADNNGRERDCSPRFFDPPSTAGMTTFRDLRSTFFNARNRESAAFIRSTAATTKQS